MALTVIPAAVGAALPRGWTAISQEDEPVGLDHESFTLVKVISAAEGVIPTGGVLRSALKVMDLIGETHSPLFLAFRVCVELGIKPEYVKVVEYGPPSKLYIISGTVEIETAPTGLLQFGCVKLTVGMSGVTGCGTEKDATEETHPSVFLVTTVWVEPIAKLPYTEAVV